VRLDGVADDLGAAVGRVELLHSRGADGVLAGARRLSRELRVVADAIHAVGRRRAGVVLGGLAVPGLVVALREPGLDVGGAGGGRQLHDVIAGVGSRGGGSAGGEQQCSEGSVQGTHEKNLQKTGGAGGTPPAHSGYAEIFERGVLETRRLNGRATGCVPRHLLLRNRAEPRFNARPT
jgi:hypothetical protein